VAVAWFTPWVGQADLLARVNDDHLRQLTAPRNPVTHLNAADLVPVEAW
jgi:hypothetical protein